MSNRKNSIDMTKGPILKNIFLFALPILISNLLQLFYSAADLVVVSRFAGSIAMGSVGATNAITNMVVASVIGISVGSNVIVARYFGAKNYDGIERAIHTSIALAAILGIAMFAVTMIFSKPILRALDTPKEVFDGAVLYTRILYIGLPAHFMYNFCAAILRALGDTRRPMYILGATGIVNVVLNLVLVIFFHMDVAGVAIATIAAQYLSAIIALMLLIKGTQDFKVVPKKIRLHRHELKGILSIGIPTSISSCLIGFSNAMVAGAVNSFGANATIGYAAATSIDSFVYMGMNSVSQATLTAISQNYGAGNYKRLFKYMRRCIYLITAIGIVLGVFVALFSHELIAIYITDNREAADFAHIRILMTVIPYFICGIMDILAQTVRGLGYSTTATVNTIWTLVGLRIVWINFILPLNHVPQVLFMCWIVSWIVAIIAHSVTIALVKNKAKERMCAK